MTRATCAGIAFSFFTHMLVVAALLAMPADSAVRHRSIVLDFSIVKVDGDGTEEGLSESASRGNRMRVASKNPGKVEGPVKHTAFPPSPYVFENEVPGETADLVRFDPDGSVTIAGEQAATGTGIRGTVAPGMAGPGSPKGSAVLDYTGSGGIDERTFSFIRRGIIEKISYPERARRMGWEGKVVLSFVVNEDGSVNNVKIIDSSGFPVLDQNAMDAVINTNFRRKVPLRFVVLLPVEYRLK